MKSYLFFLILPALLSTCASVENRSDSLAKLNDSEFQNLKGLISVAKAEADASAKHSDPGIKFFKVKTFKTLHELGTLCEAVSQEILVDQFIAVLTSPLSLEEKATHQVLIDAAKSEVEQFAAKTANPGEQYLCLNGGMDQHGSSVDEIYTFVFALSQPANFVISRTTLKYID
jgi:hypothetical protein